MFPRSLPARVISGGQPGVARAALDWAIECGIAHGGWCANGRLAEDGLIPGRYHVKEMPGAEVRTPTEENILDSAATLILNVGVLEGDSELALRIARRLDRPCFLVDIEEHEADSTAAEIRAFMATRRNCTLNVAGPRESERPGVGTAARRVLDALWGLT